MLDFWNELEKEMVSEEQRQPTGHYPSRAAVKFEDGKVEGACLRLQWYLWKRIPISDKIDTKSLWKIELGNGIHKAIQEKCISIWGKKIKTEISKVKTIKELKQPISYRIDMIFNDESVIEIKSSFGYTTTQIAKKELKTDWLLQLALYNHFEKKPCYLLYLDRGNSYRTQISVDNARLKELYPLIIKRWQVLEKYIDDNQEPPRDYTQDNWRCKYCSHRTHCWGQKECW